MAQAKKREVKAADDGKIRILLVDDHAVVRFGIAQLINRQPDMIVVGEEEDASKAMGAIATLKPSLVIADISLKDSSGLEFRPMLTKFKRRSSTPGVMSGSGFTSQNQPMVRGINARTSSRFSMRLIAAVSFT